jgi:hypothetical protein
LQVSKEGRRRCLGHGQLQLFGNVL